MFIGCMPMCLPFPAEIHLELVHAVVFAIWDPSNLFDKLLALFSSGILVYTVKEVCETCHHQVTSI